MGTSAEILLLVNNRKYTIRTPYDGGIPNYRKKLQEWLGSLTLE